MKIKFFVFTTLLSFCLWCDSFISFQFFLRLPIVIIFLFYSIIHWMWKYKLEKKKETKLSDVHILCIWAAKIKINKWIFTFGWMWNFLFFYQIHSISWKFSTHLIKRCSDSEILLLLLLLSTDWRFFMYKKHGKQTKKKWWWSHFQFRNKNSRI